MSGADSIEALAADWLARRDSGRWSDDQQQELEAWLQAATAHRIAYLRLESAWRRADRLAAAAPAAALAPSQAPAPAPAAMPPPLGRWSTWRVAAGVAIIFGAALFAARHSADGQPRQVATAIGENRLLALADGSRLTLNTATRLRTSVADGVRKVWLDSGEAYFDIAHDSAHPFVIDAGRSRITVLGTRFIVRRDGDVVSVAVAEGRVRVAQSGKEVVLAHNEAATLSDGRIALSQKSTAQLDNLLSWREGRLVIDQWTLAQAAAEFNRYNQRQLVIADPQVAAMVIGGSFAPNNVDGFARLLQQGFGLRVDSRADRIIISR